MDEELSITDDDKVSLTTAELEMLESLLAAHDRGGFYMAYNAITDSAEAALQSKYGPSLSPLPHNSSAIVDLYVSYYLQRSSAFWL